MLKTVHTLFLEGYLMNLSLKTFQQLLLSFGSVEIYAYGQSGVRFISFQINLGFNLSVHKFWLFQIKPFATAMLKLDWENNWLTIFVCFNLNLYKDFCPKLLILWKIQHSNENAASYSTISEPYISSPICITYLQNKLLMYSKKKKLQFLLWR